MKNGDRVRMKDADNLGDKRGTISRKSPFGYIKVKWDSAPVVEHFSPLSGTQLLVVVTGDEALPRHDWSPYKDDSPCRVCEEPQTEQNYRGPCFGKKEESA